MLKYDLKLGAIMFLPLSRCPIVFLSPPIFYLYDFTFVILK
jgi:hypothetical protein